MIPEIFRPLLRPLPRHAYPPLFYAFFVVGSVPEFPELRACLGVHNGLQRFFDGLPVRSARAFAWRIKTSLAISSTLRSSLTVFSSSPQLPYGNYPTI